MKKKITAIAIIAVMLAIAIVGGTLAFFTDEDEAHNTMTIGDVDLTLAETSTAEDGIAGVANSNGDGFDYTNMVPGSTYAKRATLTLSDEDDEVNAKVFVELILDDYTQLTAAVNAATATGGEYAGDTTSLDVNDHAKTWLANCTLPKSAIVGGWTDDTELHIVYYLGEWEPGHEQVLFTGITVPEKLDASLAYITDPIKLDVKGYAIQSQNVGETKTAYDQFFSEGWLNN